MQNGVPPQQGPVENPALENPNVHDPAPISAAAEFLGGAMPAREAGPDMVDPAYGAAPDMGARATNELRPPPPSPVPMTPAFTPPTDSTVRVQEFYTAGTRQERTEQNGFRWMARITEFLRTTATRSVSNVDRVLDNLGFPHAQTANQVGGLNISPPQDLQPSTLVPAVPTSWSTMRGQSTLFTEAQMRQSQRNHPQLYGPTSDGGSDRSSRLQAEVQRQMEEYMQKHQGEDYLQLQAILKGMFSSYLKVVLPEYMQLPVILKGMFSSYPMVVLQEYMELQVIPEGMFSSYPKVVSQEYTQLQVIPVVSQEYTQLQVILEGMFSSYPMVVMIISMLAKRRMAQLQAVMLKQMTAAEKDKEGEQSPLPTLPVMKVESASVDIMDWLEKLTSPTSDLSDGSGLWWEKVKASATKSYVEWAKSSPIERLKVSPPRNEELETGKWSRVNSRASSMLMLALAEGVQHEMEPPQEGVTAPDPALLARGLNAMVRKVMEKNPEASFRTSLVKSTLMVDTRPTMDSVDSYYRSSTAYHEVIFADYFGAEVPLQAFVGGQREGETAEMLDLRRTAAASSTTTTTKSVRIDDVPEVEHISATSAATEITASDQTPDIKEMLADVGKMLKQMTAVNIKKVTIVEAGFEQKVEEIEAAMKASTVAAEDGSTNGLLDSGASHAMHLAQGDEYSKGSAVKVTLAGEDVREMKQNLHGTVLVEDNGANAVQPIVPLGAVIEAKLEVLKKEEVRAWNDVLMEYTKTGNQSLLLRTMLLCPFTKDLPEDVQAMATEGFENEKGSYYLKQLPIPRRVRKLLMASDRWVVVMNQGSKREYQGPFQHHPKGVYQLLLWAASKGKISDILGTPPHSTWPTSMTPDRGPGSYPTRTTAFLYEHEGLPPLKQQRMNSETAAAVKQMMLWMVATVSRKGPVGFMMEQPADKEQLRQDDPSMASIWKTELWKSFKSVSGMGLASFYMGAMGHKGKRPTTIATNYARLRQLDGLYDFADGCVPRSLVDDKEMNTWSHGFKEIVAEAVKEFHQCSVSEEEALVEMGVKVSKLTKATGYQHRRQLHPSMFTVAIDLAGPFKQKGRDMDHEDYKYLMVAAYRCPKAYMSSKAITDYDAEMYVPDGSKAG
ncbi:GIP [Symbiodinium sp. CCMP2456]|nr:GIP [Symbiodinium sp. CCMP2456]